VRGGKNDNVADVDRFPGPGWTTPGRRHETRAARRHWTRQRIVGLKIRDSSAFIVALPRCTTQISVNSACACPTRSPPRWRCIDPATRRRRTASVDPSDVSCLSTSRLCRMSASVRTSGYAVLRYYMDGHIGIQSPTMGTASPTSDRCALALSPRTPLTLTSDLDSYPTWSLTVTPPILGSSRCCFQTRR
jgi:hypothetical protein